MVVNHNAGDLLRRCVESLLGVDWPTEVEIRIVDNASTDTSIASIADLVDANPGIEVLTQATNTGFGANNVALDDLANLDLVALVNPDAEVSPDFATALSAALQQAPAAKVGAACPKIVFDEPFRSVEVTATNSNTRLVEVELDGVDLTHRCHVVGPDAARLPVSDGRAEWHLGERAEVLVPAVEPGDLRLTFRATAPSEVTVTAQGSTPARCDVGTASSQLHLLLTAPPVRRVQNAGSTLDKFGVGSNRGFFQPDDGRFDEPIEVFAWCGAAVMLDAEYLRDVGLFAPEFFLYYEDTDLSWRGQSRGWTYRYVPEVTVGHRHSASTGQGSVTTDVYQQRNRLRMLARNGSIPLLLRGLGHAAGSTIKIGGRKLLAARQPGSKGDSALFGRRVVAFGKAVADLPSALRARRELDAARTVDRAEVESRFDT